MIVVVSVIIVFLLDSEPTGAYSCSAKNEGDEGKQYT
jgi:hypothetical protein